MRLPLAVAAVTLALLALPSAALAAPAVSVSSSSVGSTRGLPAKAQHTLTLTAGATAEELAVDIFPANDITVTGATVEPPPGGAGPSLAMCPGRWQRFHDAYNDSFGPTKVTITIAPGQTATLTAEVELTSGPWIDESLDARWILEHATLAGPLFDLISYNLDYRGPLGVQLAFRATRAPDGHIVVSGTTEPRVGSGRVQIWAFAPGSDRARRIASVRPRNGEWSYRRFMPDRRGRWELYARYRTTKPRVWTNDASECGEFVRVR